MKSPLLERLQSNPASLEVPIDVSAAGGKLPRSTELIQSFIPGSVHPTVKEQIMNTATINSSDINTTNVNQTVFVVEDDVDTREAISELLSPNCKVRTFGSAEEFLNGFTANGPSCLLLDERLPGMSGSELLRRMHDEGVTLPTIFVTAFANTPLTVEVMRNGATTVLDKPCGASAMREAVLMALSQDQSRYHKKRAQDEARKKLEGLSDSESEVLRMVLDGTPNKQIARRLNVCVRTIEARRSRIYQTTGVNSVAELVRLCVSAGFIDA